MSAGRTVAVVVLGILLTVTLSVGNVVFAAHATVLDPGFATNTIEEEGGYDALADQFQQGIASQTGDDGGSDAGTDAQASSVDELISQAGVFEEAFSSGYIESQIEPNVREVYAYLHGNRDQLNLSVDTGALAENVSASAEDVIENATTAELLALSEGDPLGDLPVNQSTVEMLDEGPDAYEQAQQDVREEVYDEVLDEAVDEAYADRSNDELLGLVIPDYDPDEYSEAEKEQMVSDREAEIKGALRTTIQDERGDELEGTVDDRLASYRQNAGGDVSTGQASFDGPVADLTSVTAEALTTDMSYSAYRSEADAARADLATAVGEYTETTLVEQMGSNVDLNEAMQIEADALSGAVSTVVWFDRLAIVLPAIALGLVGLVWYLTRSVGRTLGTVGWSMVWTGFPAFAGATFVAGRLPAVLGSGGEANAMQAVTLGIFERTVGHAAAQSLAIGVVGALFVGVAVGMRYGLFDRFVGERVETAEGEAVETQGGDDPLADRGGDGGSGPGAGGAGGRDRTGGPGGPGPDQTDSTDSGSSQHEDR